MSDIHALTLADIAALDGDRVPCPACGPGQTVAHKRNKKVLRIWRVEPGFATFCCARCGLKGYSRDGTSRASRRSVAERLASRAMRAQRKQEESADRTRRIGIAERILGGGGPAAGGPVQHYLEGRFIRPPILDIIRFSPAVWHPFERRNMPAMVARIDHPITAAFTGVHVTFLQPDGSGKAVVKPDKITRGVAAGGVVRLVEPGAALALAEGVESALSFMQLSGIPTWSALCAGNFCNVKLPTSVRDVVIAADNDERGLAEARKAGRRWRLEGRRVRIVRPTIAGQDWNDVLKGGANG